MALVQNGHFLNFFLGNIVQENAFYNILERKNAFLDYKNKKFKSRKIDIFPKGLTNSFGPKMAIFSSFFLGNIGQENVFCDILERKSVFSPKGLTNRFGPKMAIFSIFLGNIG